MAIPAESLYIVRGISMEPLLHTGDRVNLLPVQRSNLQPGDIIVFSASSGRRIIHRIIRIAPLQTRGDNCENDDPPVPLSTPLFKAVSFRRNGNDIALSCGQEGMAEHRKNQRRHKCIYFARRVFRPIALLNPFKVPFSSLTQSSFGERTVFYSGKRPVGWMDEDGWHWMGTARFWVQAPPDVQQQ